MKKSLLVRLAILVVDNIDAVCLFLEHRRRQKGSTGRTWSDRSHRSNRSAWRAWKTCATTR